MSLHPAPVRACARLPRPGIVCLLLALAVLSLAGCGNDDAPQATASNTPVERNGDGPAPAEKTTGETPFFPSRQTTPDGEPLALTDYASNQDCFRCHEDIAEQWQGSMHSSAMTDPIFLALYKIGSQETEGKTDKWCIGCHSSPAILSGKSAPQEIAELAAPVNEGVSCVVCHSINEPNLKDKGDLPSNASFVSNPAGPIVGPHKGLKCLQRDKKTIQSDFRKSSEFCASCHRLVHPWNGLVIERTYEEWRDSIYATRGIQCQDCHMQPVDKMVETAKTLKRADNPGKLTSRTPERKHVYNHNFLGGNTAAAEILGHQQHRDMAVDMLQNSASLELVIADRAFADEIVQLRVKVTNETAGHNLPTSLVEIRQMWLDVQVTDKNGEEIYRSGGLDSKGEIDPDAVVFHAVAVDEQGEPTVKPWEMASFTYSHAIPARGHTIERYAFQIPPGTPGPVTVKAILKYRSLSQQLANELLGDEAPIVPVTDMETAAVTLMMMGDKK